MTTFNGVMKLTNELESENGEDDFDIVEPSASCLVESMRAFGYSPETAIADLIDNSITAKATNIWLNFHWSGKQSFVTIMDDGRGMTEFELVKAMRPGSQHPLEARDRDDLGRFGLGLKTASFSQCRSLTLATKTSSSRVSTRRWDLDYLSSVTNAGVSGWRLLRSSKHGSETRLGSIKKIRSGTIVLWESLDRVVGDVDVQDSQAQDRFYSVVKSITEHLAMVFHRFLDGPRPRLSIFINGEDSIHRLVPWDPFLRFHVATWSTPPELISFGGAQIKIQGFVLPHKDRLSANEYQLAAGPKGWNAQQGFYVYRNERMLVSGSWLGLGSPRSWAKEEHYKLGRITIDIPNSLDGDWQIDVKK